MNDLFTALKTRNGGNPAFFSFGTASAMPLVSSGLSLGPKHKGKNAMNIFNNLSSRAVAGVASLAFSAFFLAAAIVPATPTFIGGGVIA